MIICEIAGNCRVEMKGHATLGNEVVCAGASALALALVESMESVAGIGDDKITIEIDEGYLLLDLKNSANDKSDALIGYFRTGMEGLERTYPKLVKVIRRNYENSKL